MSKSKEPPEEGVDGGTDHVDDVPDGAGCTEIWEHLSDRRGGDGEPRPSRSPGRSPRPEP